MPYGLVSTGTSTKVDQGDVCTEGVMALWGWFCGSYVLSHMTLDWDVFAKIMSNCNAIARTAAACDVILVSF